MGGGGGGGGALYASTVTPLFPRQSANEELERLRDSSKTSALVRSLRNQLEEQQASTQASVKSLKRVQDDLDESVVQVDELTHTKLEVYTTHTYICSAISSAS